jgi:xylulokinase
MECILAYDIGGSTFKAGLIDARNEFSIIEIAQQDPPAPDHRGYCESDPARWWQDLLGVTRALLEKPEANQIEIIGIVVSGITRTQVFLDKNGKLIRPAMNWADGRARAQAEKVAHARAQIGLEGKTFGPVNVFHTLARLLWVKENEPDVFARLHIILEPKDYMNYRLTGELGGDLISLSRILTVSGQNLPIDLLNLLDLPPHMIPPLRNPQTQLGVVRDSLEQPLDRLAGTPVFVGGMDAWCGSLGIGAQKTGCAYNVSGTSEVFGIVTDSFKEVPNLVTLPWGIGLYQIGGPSQAGADCMAWFIEAFGDRGLNSEPAVAMKKLPEMKRQPEPILFMPYLRGERVPLWDPDVRGLFLGMNRRHSWADFMWAIIEGVSFANRQILELASTDGTQAVQEIRITGGAATSDLWCQIKADVLNLPVIRTRSTEAGLLGGAMLALVGLGRHSNIDECQKQFVKIERTFRPRPERTAIYDQLYKRWIETQTHLLPLSRQLTQDVANGVNMRLC